MSRNGSGTMVKTGDDAVFDTVISESYYNNQINDIINALTQSVSKDGQTTLTGNLNAGSKKLTAMAVGTALTDSVTLGQSQNGAANYIASDSGSADAYAIAPAPAITSYSAGQIFWFIAGANSTGASTINVSGLGTKAIQIAGSAISGASITTGGVTGVIYDGTQFQLLSEDQTVSALTIADESSDTTCFVSFSTAATGIYAPKSGTNLTFNSSTGELVSTIGNFTTLQENSVGVGLQGQHTIFVPAGAMEAAVTTAAATSNAVEIGTSLFAARTMDFATDADDFAYFGIQMPKSWNAGALVCQFVWSATGTTANTVLWGIAANSIGNDGVLTEAFATPTSPAADTNSTTADDIMISAEVSLTVGSTPTAEDFVIFEVSRDVSGDTLAENARLHGIKIHYTTDTGNDN